MSNKNVRPIERNYLECILKNNRICKISTYINDVAHISNISYGWELMGVSLIIYLNNNIESDKNPNTHFSECSDVAFEIENKIDICSFEKDLKFKSLIGRGSLSLIEKHDEKLHALKKFMLDHTSKNFEFKDDYLEGISFSKIVTNNYLGRI